MTDEKIQQFQKQLFDLRDRLVGAKRQLLDQIRKPVDDAGNNDIYTSSLRPDTASVSESDEEVAIGLYDNVEHTHAEITTALRRIADGKFGLCESCGKRIAQIRLKVIPYARRCVTCSNSPASIAQA